MAWMSDYPQRNFDRVVPRYMFQAIVYTKTWEEIGQVCV